MSLVASTSFARYPRLSTSILSRPVSSGLPIACVLRTCSRQCNGEAATMAEIGHADTELQSIYIHETPSYQRFTKPVRRVFQEILISQAKFSLLPEQG